MEKDWPADEQYSYDGKVVGLQFKRPQVAPLRDRSHRNFDQLGWTLDQPKGQYEFIRDDWEEIFYCLPTFINRDYRREALHHCMFWRPGNDVDAKNTWYCNPRARSAHAKLVHHPLARRWGHFFEALQACKIGTRVDGREGLSAFVNQLLGKLKNRELLTPMSDMLRENGENHESKELFDLKVPLYLLHVSINSSLLSSFDSSG